MFFSVYTLGCKLNQHETEAITDSFRREGYTISQAPRGSGIIMINTCTVTSMAEQKARRIIRKMLREYPSTCLILTGCYAQLDGAALAALEEKPSGRLFIVPGGKKDRIMDLPGFLAKAGIAGTSEPDIRAVLKLTDAWFSEDSSDSEDGSFRFRPEKFSFHSRAFIKIQDGCDRRCSYCRVSLARGKSRSLEARKILAELLSMEERGIAEAVLTGVNIGQYRDSEQIFQERLPQQFPQKPLHGLPGLLSFLLKETNRIRLRLSSLEPDELDEEFIRVLASQRIRPHFHLSLQSGSSAILRKMGRPYSPEHVEKTAAMLRSARQDPFLACDIIAGFPGETGADFEKTLQLCESIGFAWIHAFPYSRRPGTAAYHFPERVSERDTAKRTEQLSVLARKGRLEYIRRWEGKEVEAVIEAGNNQHRLSGIPGNSVPGVSENYLKLCISCMGESPLPAPGALVRCRIGKAALPEKNRESTLPVRFDAFSEKVYS